MIEGICSRAFFFLFYCFDFSILGMRLISWISGDVKPRKVICLNFKGTFPQEFLSRPLCPALSRLGCISQSPCFNRTTPSERNLQLVEFFSLTLYNSLGFEPWLFRPEKDLFWKQDGDLVQVQKRAQRHKPQRIFPRRKLVYSHPPFSTFQLPLMKVANQE